MASRKALSGCPIRRLRCCKKLEICQLLPTGGHCTHEQVDFTSSLPAQAAAEQVAKNHSHVDYLINNAGVLGKFAQVVDQ